MKKLSTFLVLLLCLINVSFLSKAYGQAPATLPYIQNFSTANDLTLTNGTQTNKWVYGSAVGNAANSLYISNDNGVTNAYTIASATSIVQAYRDIVIPTGTTTSIFAFDWKGDGESTYDLLRVWLVPTSYTPVAGTSITAGTGRIQVGGNYNQQTTWQNYLNTNLNLSTFAGSTMRLVFEWKNDGSGGNQPPAAIDNINLLIPTCFMPTPLAPTAITAATATISWTAPTPAPANGYAYYVSTSNVPPTAATAPTGTTAAGVTTANVAALTPNTTYYWWVRSVCGPTDNSLWTTGASFLTAQIPAALPYTQNFNTSNDLGYTTGNQVNKWAYGSIVGNAGNSIYISNDNGVTNSYNTSSSVAVHAYRDITIPTGTTLSTLTFDWKGNGESTYDLLKVWLVPISYMPIAGTGITAGAGRIQVGSSFNQQTTWQNYLNTNVNLTTFAGLNMRLVFEWVNDGSGGTQPPIAVDNINLFIPTCFVPTAMGVGTVGSSTSTINWTAPTPAPGNGYAYYLSMSSVPPTVATTPTGTTAAGVTTANLTGLTPNTTYYWWVRSVCSPTDNSIWVTGPSFTTGQIPTTLPYVQNFNTANDLGFTSTGQTNKWAYGSATGNTGNSVYISNNNGVVNAYTISGAVSTVHAYRDVIVPGGSTIAYLAFDWKSVGEASYDYLRVWVVPTSYTPVAGTQITAGAGRIQIGGDLNSQAAWQNFFDTNVALTGFAGSTMRLVFEWKNDGSGGTQPPAAIDNINLYIPTCLAPTALTTSTVGATNATIGWTPPSPAPGNGYQYYLSTVNTAPTASTVATGASATNTFNLTPLVPNTAYYWWVRSVCGATDRSIWVAGPSFTTTQIPATLPYVQNFTGVNDFGFTTGTQVNKWAYGSATGNTGNSIYISNNSGTANAYTITSTSTTHAYRDIAIPTGTSIATFSYDWKAVGESTFDYFRVWLVPATFMPVAGVQITAGTGRIQLGNIYNLQATWQNYLNSTLNLSSFAGTTMRLVYEWKNDGGGGVQPPVAIDNVILRVCSNVTPVVTVTAASITHNTATITWPQDIGGASYSVRYRPVGSGSTWTTVAVASVNTATNTYNLAGLLSATLYEVEVAAVCNNTPGVYSHNEFTTKCDPTPPNVTVSNITTTSALITWAPLAASSSYTLRWRKVGTTGWPNAEIALPLAPANTYTLSNLDVYTSYEVQVANKCDGTSILNPWSNSQVFTTERTCNIAPPGLTITQLNPTSAVVVWDPFPGATYILRYRKVGIPGWTNLSVSTNTYTLTGLAELTQYEMQVSNVCTGTPGTYTQPYVFTTPTVTYCPMVSASAANEFISKVTVKPNGKPVMDNVSTGSTYTNYTATPAKFIELIQGSTGNEIIIEKSWLGANNSAGIAVWIDFDRNGYFDINERILASAPSTTTPIKGTFSVPVDAFISLTDYKYVVMRVAMQKDAIPVNCTSFANGEVEDYTVRISKNGIPNAANQTDIMIYPNPVHTVLNVKNISTKANYKIYNAAGQIVSKGIILNNKIDVNKLINGLYVIDIEDVKGTAQKKFIKE